MLQVRGHAGLMFTLVRDSSDTDEESGESIYTDAAEHLSDLEVDGFGSISAIVQSSITVTAELAIAIAPSSPVRLTSQNTTSEKGEHCLCLPLVSSSKLIRSACVHGGDLCD